MKKSQNVLWIIDVLTIIFVLIALQSIAVCFVELSNSESLPLKEVIFASIKYCGISGWSEILHDYLGPIVPWSKTLLFFANIYAVILKLIGIIRRTIPTKRFAFIVINLLFIVLKLIEFDSFLTALMSV